MADNSDSQFLSGENIKIIASDIDSEDEYIEDIEDFQEFQDTEIQSSKYYTKPVLTKYEKAKILGTRAMQISRNAPLFIEIGPGDTDPLLIADKELNAKKLPFIVRRTLPDGKYEDWKLSDLSIPD